MATLIEPKQIDAPRGQGLWISAGNVAAMTTVGMPAFTAVGTATVRSVSTTNTFTQVRRVGYVSAATAPSLAGIRSGALQFFRSTTAGMGGFRLSFGFGISDATITPCHMFCGLVPSTAAPTNVNPNTMLNSFGVGCQSGAGTLSIYTGNATSVSELVIGAPFSVLSANTNWYYVTLEAPPGLDVVYYRITASPTGTTVEGSITATLPALGTLLAPTFWRSNNATAAAVGLDLANIQMLTPY